MCGFDYTLRIGNIKESVIVKTLFRKNNILILEYKPLSTYPTVLEPSAVQLTIIFIQLTLIALKIRKRFRKSKDLPLLCNDSEWLWYERSGYLGPRAF